jgi:hypothetical protein
MGIRSDPVGKIHSTGAPPILFFTLSLIASFCNALNHFFHFDSLCVAR